MKEPERGHPDRTGQDVAASFARGAAKGAFDTSLKCGMDGWSRESVDELLASIGPTPGPHGEALREAMRQIFLTGYELGVAILHTEATRTGSPSPN